MIFKVIDNNGKPIRKALNVPGKPTRELELTIYSDTEKGALKCLVMQNFALIQKPSDSRTQSAQLSYNIAAWYARFQLGYRHGDTYLAPTAMTAARTQPSNMLYFGVTLADP